MKNKSIIHYSSKVLFIGLGISKLFLEAKENILLCMVMGTLFGLLIMFLIKKKKTSNKSILLFILLYILLIITSFILVSFIKNIYLINMEQNLLIIPLLILLIYMNSKDIDTHYKILNILLYVSLIPFIISILLLIPYIKTINYFPLLNTNNNLLLSSLKFSLYSTIPNIIDSNNIYFKKYILSNSILFIFIFVLEGVLGINLINIFKYPEYIVLKKINYLNFIQNMENLLSFMYIFILIGYISICSKKLYDISYNIFKSEKIYPIFLTVSLLLITNLLFDNIIFGLFLDRYLWIVLFIIFCLYFFVNKKST